MSDTNMQQNALPVVAVTTAPTATPKSRIRSTSRGSLADLFRDWSELLAAVAEHGTDLPTLETQRTALQGFLSQCQALSVQQNALTANSQVTTQQLQAAVRAGSEQASRLRAGIKSAFGFTDEKLVQFGSKPLRRRRLAKPEPAVTPAPE